MICAWCKSDIENDSFFCDQCSKEIFLCPECGKPGKGKSCIADGNPLYSPKQKAGGVPNAAPAPPQKISLFGGPAQQQAAPQPIPQPAMPQSMIQPSPSAYATPSPSPSPSPMPQPFPQPQPQGTPGLPGLKLINRALNIELDIKDGGVIGRSSGDYVQVFSQFSQVSGRHMQFKFDSIYGWTVVDLGSTNGVALSSQPNWNQVAKISPNTAVAVKENGFLLIANIEFQLKVIPLSTAQGTVRV